MGVEVEVQGGYVNLWYDHFSSWDFPKIWPGFMGKNGFVADVRVVADMRVAADVRGIVLTLVDVASLKAN